MGNGFIRDKLDIKFLILYIAARIIEPLPLEGMQELTMCDDAIDYFDFSVCLADLVKTEHLSMTEDNKYCITPKGLKNSEICESSLPYSVRMKAEKKITAYNKELKRLSQVQGKVTPRENGTYTVELSFNDDVDNLMKLQLMVATEDMAKDLASRFRKDPEKVYASIVETLYSK